MSCISDREDAMLELNNKNLQESDKPYAEQVGKGFAKIQMLLDATGGLSLSQVCAVTGLEGSTIQNWVKRGWVSHPIGKKYEEVHIARILIINALKECIKLEHIAKLMKYVNGKPQDGVEPNIKESTLYDFLCEALKQSGQTDDHSKGGVEGVVDRVIRKHREPDLYVRDRIRKALTLMIYACVCTDVKRRTESMMKQVLTEMENPAPAPAAVLPKLQLDKEPEPVLEEPEVIPDNPVETRKTVSQALREWDISSVEKIIIDHDEDARSSVEEQEDKEEKSQTRPWYVRKNTK